MVRLDRPCPAFGTRAPLAVSEVLELSQGARDDVSGNLTPSLQRRRGAGLKAAPAEAFGA